MIQTIEDRPIEYAGVSNISMPKGDVLSHYDLVSLIGPSAMRMNVCKLLKDLPAKGSVLVWEKKELTLLFQGLMLEYPDLKKQLENALSGMIEIKPWFETCIVRNTVVHNPNLSSTMKYFYPEQPDCFSEGTPDCTSFAIAQLFKMAIQLHNHTNNMVLSQEEIANLENVALYYMDKASNLLKQEDKEHEAVSWGNKAIDVYARLAKYDESRFLIPLIDALLECATLEFLAFESDHTEEHCLRAIDLCEKLKETDLREAMIRLCQAYGSLSTAALEQKDIKKESEALTKQLECCKQLRLNNSDEYSKEYLEVLYRLAFCHCSLNQYELAEEEYVELSKLVETVFIDNVDNPVRTKAQVYEDWGRLCKIQNQTDRAIEKFDVAIEMYSTMNNVKKEIAHVLEAKARCYHTQEQIEKAIHLIDQAIAMDPNNADWYDTKGYFVLKQGREKEALHLWAKVLKMEPEHLDYGYSDLYESLKEKHLV